MTPCTGSNQTKICRQRETCALYQAYLGMSGSGPVAIVSMPVSAASSGCYRYEPAGIREAVRKTTVESEK